MPEVANARLEAALSWAKANKIGVTTARKVDDAKPENRVISTGIAGIDRIIGTGGIPRGKWTHLYALESAGKSSLAQHIVAHGQREGLVFLWADLETTWDPVYAQAIGVDTDALLMLDLGGEDGGEEVIDAIEKIVRAGLIDAFVIDSIGALIPGKRFESEVGKALPAMRARLVTEMLERLNGPIARTNTAGILINQLTGTMKSDFHGNEILIPKGGRALRYFSSLNILLKRKNKPNEAEGEAVSSDVTIKVEKNKVAPAFREAELVLEFGKGFDVVADLVNVAGELGVITKAGAWLTFQDLKVAGADKFVASLRGPNRDLMRALYARTLQAIEAEHAAHRADWMRNREDVQDLLGNGSDHDDR